MSPRLETDIGRDDAVALIGRGVTARLMSRAEIEGRLDAWRDLESAAGAYNPFFTAGALAPALDAFAGPAVRILTVADGETLLGLVPVSPARRYARLLAPHLTTWLHPHCYLGEPLVRTGAEAIVLAAMASIVDRRDSQAAFLRLEMIDPDGPAGRFLLSPTLRRPLGGRFVSQAGMTERAALLAGPDGETYLTGVLRKKKRKELARLRNRLSAEGPVRYETFSADQDLDEWLKLFLALEGAGWKGEQGTHLDATDAHRSFFTSMVHAAAGAGTLRFDRLTVGATTIAMIVCLMRDGAGCSFKICHDPAFNRFSPGVMLELELTKALLDASDFTCMDSCASPDHPMINHLWHDRRRLVGVNVSARRPTARALLALCTALESAAATVRRAAASQTPRQEPEEDDRV